jgi:hypothetical protein
MLIFKNMSLLDSLSLSITERHYIWNKIADLVNSYCIIDEELRDIKVIMIKLEKLFVSLYNDVKANCEFIDNDDLYNFMYYETEDEDNIARIIIGVTSKTWDNICDFFHDETWEIFYKIKSLLIETHELETKN